MPGRRWPGRCCIATATRTRALEAAEQAARFGPEASYAPAIKEQALRRLGRVEEADALWSELLAKRRTRLGQGAAHATKSITGSIALDRCRAIATPSSRPIPTRAEGLKDLASLMMAEGEFELAQEVLDRASRHGARQQDRA